MFARPYLKKKFVFFNFLRQRHPIVLRRKKNNFPLQQDENAMMQKNKRQKKKEIKDTRKKEIIDTRKKK